MKKIALVLLAILIPVSSAYAVESPFTTRAVQTNRVNLPKNPFATKNPFSNTRADQVMKNLRRHQPQVNNQFDYNGDDNPTYAKSRERLKSSPINRSRSSDSSVFYRD